MNQLKKKIISNQPVHGCWINLGSNVSTEIMGAAGFDWLLIDLEHGAGDFTMLFQQLQVLKHAPSASIVRVDELLRPKVQRILDFGATGVMFPQIHTAAEAQEAATMLYYPPVGIRGVAKMVRAMDYGKSFDAYYQSMADQLVCVVQIESAEAVKNCEAIAAATNVDVLFVGPSDLTMSLGIFGQFMHADYLAAIDKVANAAAKASKACGILLWDLDHYEMYYKKGYRFFAMGSDAGFVINGSNVLVKALEARRPS